MIHALILMLAMQYNPCPPECSPVRDARDLTAAQLASFPAGANVVQPYDPTVWPGIASMQLVFSEAQQKAFPENAHIKPCGPDNHEGACYEGYVLTQPPPQATFVPADHLVDGRKIYTISTSADWTCRVVSIAPPTADAATAFTVVCVKADDIKPKESR